MVLKKITLICGTFFLCNALAISVPGDEVFAWYLGQPRDSSQNVYVMIKNIVTNDLLCQKGMILRQRDKLFRIWFDSDLAEFGCALIKAQTAHTALSAYFQEKKFRLSQYCYYYFLQPEDLRQALSGEYLKKFLLHPNSVDYWRLNSLAQFVEAYECLEPIELAVPCSVTKKRTAEAAASHRELLQKKLRRKSQITDQRENPLWEDSPATIVCVLGCHRCAIEQEALEVKEEKKPDAEQILLEEGEGLLDWGTDIDNAQLYSLSSTDDLFVAENSTYWG